MFTLSRGSGGGGIRTHKATRASGFQDRPISRSRTPPFKKENRFKNLEPKLILLYHDFLKKQKLLVSIRKIKDSAANG